MINFFVHQRKALELTKNRNRVAYFHDMGLGKTFTGAEKMVRLGASMNLLICQKSKIQDWVEHFEKYYAYPGNLETGCNPYHVIDLTTWKREDFQNDDKFITSPLTVGQRIYVINYELAWRRKELLELRDFTLMLDESSLIQNREAKQTKFILKLQPANVILLSGTPTAGKYENLWTQAHLLGWNISERLFQNQYVNRRKMKLFSGQYISVVDKENPYKNVERLKEKFREHGAVFLKTEECFDLPEQTFIEIKVSNSKEYRKFMKDSIVQLADCELVGDTNLTKRLHARQLCGMYSKDKLSAFRDLVESTNDRLIVFYNFTDELKQMESVLPLDRPYDIINGKMKTLNAYENHSDAVVFIQYQAGAMGLNLQKANKIVYFSPPERCELWMQSQKRIHRIGQEKPCYYYKLVCKNSVEEQIYRALERGVDFTDELFRKGV